MSHADKLKQIVEQSRWDQAHRERFLGEITTHIQLTSPCLHDANFTRIHADDLRLLFELYDEYFFGGGLGQALRRSPLTFRLSRRMTRAGGTTTRFRARFGRRNSRYEIAVSTTLLFESFKNPERGITVTGLECDSRLDALMRIMEHELVHLAEMIVWDDSSCSQRRFQGIASRIFGHTDHRHDLMTPRETAAAEYGIRPGTRVRFDFDGHVYKGIVNRITRRATVLVPDPAGEPFSDGKRYLKFYIPVQQLVADD